jgi:hypothetical protein
VNSEQFLVGQEAQVMIRPQLTINGRMTSVKLLKNTKVKITIKDYLGNPDVSREYSSLNFHDD